MNKIKVLLATFNGEKYIEEQINSIASQKGVEVDITVNDDGSTDNTIELIKSIFPNINIRINIPPTGSAANNFLKILLNGIWQPKVLAF